MRNHFFTASFLQHHKQIVQLQQADVFFGDGELLGQVLVLFQALFAQQQLGGGGHQGMGGDAKGQGPVMGDPAGVGVLADLDGLLVQDVHIHPDVVIGLTGHLGRMLFFPWPPA